MTGIRKNRVSKTTCFNCPSENSGSLAIAQNQIEMFARDNVAVMMAWNFLLMTIALFIIVFCFLIPNSKDWAKRRENNIFNKRDTKATS